MTLTEIIDDVLERDYRLVVVGGVDAEGRELLESFFRAQGAEVAFEGEGGVDEEGDGDNRSISAETAVLYRDGARRADADVDSLTEYVRRDRGRFETNRTEPPLVAELTSGTTTIREQSRGQMLQGSRVIEHLAWQSKTGRLHGGFQRFSRFTKHIPTRNLYRRLGESGVDVHVHGVPNVEVEGSAGLSVHPHTEEDELRTTWFVVYQGEEDDAALLAQERSPDRYSGLWTFDGALTTEVRASVESQMSDAVE
ncbi:DICT sensory domain-containing protein [Halogeometricum luteum]|uniref:DICT domain-containing protein n=1 Tax=Halogeometricum luteum TaxID=2950537 RepID=A0ABU2G463_9EURY|nr:DICT sensory domain-containing protein [Halogeometricum sp. S3BR5-2]MDS0295586.1 hypothetical protein [Halogeometricum sp. S3BR5-2]